MVYIDPTGRDYDIFDKDGTFIRTVSDADVSTLQLDTERTGSADGTVIYLMGGLEGHFVDNPTNDVTDNAPTCACRLERLSNGWSYGYDYSNAELEVDVAYKRGWLTENTGRDYSTASSE